MFITLQSYEVFPKKPIFALKITLDSMKKSLVLLCFVCFVMTTVASAQIASVRVAFWNMENFFDPFVDSTRACNAFTEEGMQHWTKSRFYT